MMIKQTCINVLLPIAADTDNAVRGAINTQALEQALANIDTLHFLSVALLPQDNSAAPKLWLMIEANFDGDRDTFLAQLWVHAREALSPAFIAGDIHAVSLAAFMQLLKDCDQGPGVNHTALPGMDVGLIRRSVEVYKKVQVAMSKYASATSSASALCDAIAQDKDVQETLLPVPDKWPEDTLKQWHPVIAMSFSFVLSFMLVAATGIPPLAHGDSSLPLGLLLCGMLFLVPLLVLRGNSTSTSFSVPKLPPSRVFRVAIVALIIGLNLYAFHLLSSWLIPLYVLGFDLLFLALIFFTLNSVPATLGLEYFLVKPIVLSAVFPLGVLAVSIGSAGPIAFAADIWLATLLVLVFVALFFAPSQPLEPIDKHGMLCGLIVYLLLPFPVPELMQGIAIGMVILFLGIVAALICALCRVQQQENFDYESPPLWESNDTHNSIARMEAEHCKRQNHFISITYVKPGRLRWFSMRLVLFLVGAARSLQGKRGELSGIVTIHFARWILVGEKKSQLLFISNYGGNWGSYLDEFIDHASEGLTSIWSNTIGFPRSEWLRNGGAANAQRFKLFARRSQWPTLYHYSAYPELTVDQIEKYVRLNTLLAKQQRSKDETEEVLRLL